MARKGKKTLFIIDPESEKLIESVSELTGRSKSEVVRGAITNIKDTVPGFLLEKKQKKKVSYDSKLYPYKRASSRLIYLGDLAKDLDAYKDVTGVSKSTLMQQLLRKHKEDNPHLFDPNS